MNPTLPRNVLYLQASDGMHSVRRRNAVERIAVAKGWVLRSSRYAADERGECLLRREKALIPFREMGVRWALDGVIVECDEARYGRMAFSQFGALPTVAMDAGKAPRGIHRSAVLRDESAIGAMAARELLESGFGDYAFVPHPGNPKWSREREAGFASAIRAAGKRFICGRRLETPSDSMSDWIAVLPRPVGVFAANDMDALQILGACRALDFRVPDDVGVLGVDDKKEVCESSQPALTSIAIDYEAEGAFAMRLLANMLDAPQTAFPPCKCCFSSVSRRESTRFDTWGDVRIRRGLEFIRLKACDGIVPNDVAKAMFVSLTVAKDIFRKKAGTTILAEIHAARLVQAREMLAHGVQPDIVAQNCGYGSVNDFRRVFKRRTGTTIGKWLRDR